jgi:hypothetical protein
MTKYTLYSDNYAFDFYKWEEDRQCAEKVAKVFIPHVIKSATKAAMRTNRKALILHAIQTNNFENFPDSDSQESIDTDDFNEVHHTFEIDETPEKIKTNWFACFKLNCWSKK